MSVQSNNNPVLPSVHSLVNYDPKSVFRQLQEKASYADTMTKVCMVAVAVIGFAAIAVKYLLSSPPYYLCAAIFISMLSTPLIAMKAEEYGNECAFFLQKAKDEQLVVDELKSLEGVDPKILKAYRSNDNKEIPFEQLLPLIARIQAKANQALNLKKELLQNIASAKDADSSNKCLAIRNTAWTLLERKALPLLVDAAFSAQVLKDPFMPNDFEQAYRLVPKTFAEREFDKTWGCPSDSKCGDEYINSSDGKLVATFDQVMKSNSAEELRKVLFENKDSSGTFLTKDLSA